MLKHKAILPIAVAVLLMALPEALLGQRNPRWGNGGVEFNAHLGLMNDEPEFKPGANTQELPAAIGDGVGSVDE